MQINRFNVRVYGIYRLNAHSICVSKETYGNMHMLKFPGGGLEFGEGPLDCLIREFQEEFHYTLHPSSLRPLWFNSNCIPSILGDNSQILALYYAIQHLELPILPYPTHTHLEDIPNGLYSLDLYQNPSSYLSFPADKALMQLIMNNFSMNNFSMNNE